MNNEVLKVKTLRSTWGGRAATMTEHRLQKSPLGLRIVVMEYDDSADVDVRLVKGDGRKPSFETRAQLTVTRPEIAEAVAHLVRNPGA